MPEPMPAPAPAPDHGGRGGVTPPDTVHIATVRWRVRDETGRGIGQWTVLPDFLTIEQAVHFQTIWLADLDVDVRVPSSGTYA